MVIPKNSKFALVGHGYALFHLYKEFLKHKLPKPIIITHLKKFHKRDIREAGDRKKIYRNIFELNKEAKIFYVEDINCKKVYDILKKNKISHLFSISSRFIFKDKIIKKYSKKIFNIHGTLLPSERGSGAYTYRIMNSKYFCAATIHIIDNKIDTGEILMQSKKKYISKNSLPIDFISNTNQIYLKLIKSFVSKIYLKKKFNLSKQNEKKAMYLPRFFTEKMGFINFTQKGKDIEQFIKGCSKPYSGAHCLVNFKKRHLKLKVLNAKFVKQNTNHPFLYGKITYKDAKKFKILVQDGYLVIELKNIKLEKSSMKKYLLNKTCYNHLDDLRNSYLIRTNVFKNF